MTPALCGRDSSPQSVEAALSMWVVKDCLQRLSGAEEAVADLVQLLFHGVGIHASFGESTSCLHVVGDRV